MVRPCLRAILGSASGPVGRRRCSTQHDTYRRRPSLGQQIRRSRSRNKPEPVPSAFWVGIASAARRKRARNHRGGRSGVGIGRPARRKRARNHRGGPFWAGIGRTGRRTRARNHRGGRSGSDRLHTWRTRAGNRRGGRCGSASTATAANAPGTDGAGFWVGIGCTGRRKRSRNRYCAFWTKSACCAKHHCGPGFQLGP